MLASGGNPLSFSFFPSFYLLWKQSQCNPTRERRSPLQLPPSAATIAAFCGAWLMNPLTRNLSPLKNQFFIPGPSLILKSDLWHCKVSLKTTSIWLCWGLSLATNAAVYTVMSLFVWVTERQVKGFMKSIQKWRRVLRWSVWGLFQHYNQFALLKCAFKVVSHL